jgi:hypothetical protein
MANLLVEGLTDAAFFQHLFERLYLQGLTVRSGARPGRENIPASFQGALPDGTLLEVNLTIAWGRDQIRPAMGALLRRDVAELVVAQDIDEGSPQQVVQSIRDSVYEELGLPRPRGQPDSRVIEVTGRTVHVLPMGLYQDPTLASLGITSHAMEDYLIKLLLEDANLRRDVSELRSLLLQILPVIHEHDGSFPSSKDLFQLIKPMLQHGFSDTRVVEWLFQSADPDILQSVLAPVLADVELALVPQ